MINRFFPENNGDSDSSAIFCAKHKIFIIKAKNDETILSVIASKDVEIGIAGTTAIIAKNKKPVLKIFTGEESSIEEKVVDIPIEKLISIAVEKLEKQWTKVQNTYYLEIIF